jgi:tight adherence protein C
MIDILAMDWGSGVWDLVISAGLFVTVILLVLSIFSQQGQYRRSPQRQAAIAAGQTDRRTLFENPIVGPVLWVLLRVAAGLRAPGWKRWLQRQLVAAGSPNHYTVEEYLALSFLGGIGIGVVLQLFHFVLTGRFGILTLLLGVLIGIALMMYQIFDQASKRLMSITRQLPYSMDLLSLAMGAGATFVEALRTIIRDESELEEIDPLSQEWIAVLAEIELGTTRRQALRNFAERTPLESVHSLVASVIQAEELGTPLIAVLRDQAKLLRERRSLRAEEKAAAAGVRILVPCLLLVMACIMTVFGPFAIRIAREGMF